METRSVTRKPITTCTECGQKVLKSKLRRHLGFCRTRDGGGMFECKERKCPKAFQTKQSLKSHMRAVHSKPIKCTIPGCDSVIQISSHAHHIRTVHKKAKEECIFCGAKVIYGSLSEHVRLCTNDGSRPYECGVDGCKTTFRTALGKSRHFNKVHRSPIECPFPGCKVVCKKASLPQHVRQVHDKCKEQCPNCGLKVVYGILSVHLKRCTNDGSRPYKCTAEGCSKSFRTTADRSGHLYSVHKGPVKCDLAGCDAVLKSKASLKSHKKIVHDKIKEECPKCERQLCFGYLSKHLKLCKGLN